MSIPYRSISCLMLHLDRVTLLGLHEESLRAYCHLLVELRECLRIIYRISCNKRAQKRKHGKRFFLGFRIVHRSSSQFVGIEVDRKGVLYRDCPIFGEITVILSFVPIMSERLDLLIIKRSSVV